MLIKNNSISEAYQNIYDFHNLSLSIPIFQRFYDWNEKQIGQLLQDILENINSLDKQIYLLDFIYYEEDGKIKLADGQQRVVSLNILIRCINEHIEKNNLLIDKLEGFDISYDNAEYNKKYVDSFENYMVAPFKKMYVYLSNFIDNNSSDISKIIYVIKNCIYIYAKKTLNADTAYSIFAQINTGGKPLSKDEVMRTAIDQYSKIYDVEVDVSKKNLKKAITSYYKYLNSESSGDFDTIEIMSFIKQNVVINKDKFKSFSSYVKKINSLSYLPISYIIDYINRSQLFDILNIMMLKGINLNEDNEYTTEVVFPLCLLSMAMTMKKSNPGGIIKSLYSTIIESIKNDEKCEVITEKICKFINENKELCTISFCDFLDCLGKREITTNLKKAILIMDIMLCNSSSSVKMTKINLEHIYPQKPRPIWAAYGWPTSQDERSLLINNIGNYLILNELVNKRIQNDYVDKKFVEYKRIIEKDMSLQTVMNTIDFKSFETLKGMYIRARQKDIAKIIYKEFPLAQVIIVDFPDN